MTRSDLVERSGAIVARPAAADPAVWMPRPGWWGHTWRLAAMLAVSGFALVDAAPARGGRVGLVLLDLLLGLVGLVLVHYRRRWPVTVAVVVTLFSAVSGTAAGPAVLAAVSLATRRRIPQVVMIGVLGVASAQVYTVINPSPSTTDPWWLDLTLLTAVTVAMLAVGMYIGSRRELHWSQQQQALRAQEARVVDARAAERERIAREMHDVLAHRISMVSMHAGALAYRTDLPPEQVRETAELIQRTSHQALTELRQVLGTLRADEATMADRPQPRLADVPTLVEEAREAGMDIDLTLGVPDTAELPEAVGRTVYRIVQEGLTNARKHAAGTTVAVSVAGDPAAGLDVCVRNGPHSGLRPSRVPGSGLGLVGLRERAALVGGRIEVERQGGGFVLHGWLPWHGEAA